MKGVKFDDIHSYTDLNLVLSGVNIPPAKPKTTFVDLPGANGSVDLTEALGEVKFADRECSFTFTVFPYEDFEEKKRQISNLLNGKRCNISLDKDPGYFWTGRCSVDSYESNKNLHKIVVKATVAPYKLKQDLTYVAAYFCGKNLCHATVTRTGTYNGITLTRHANSSEVILDGVAEREFSLIAADEMMLYPGTYTLSVYGLNNINTNNDRCYLYDLDNEKAVINYVKPGKPGTFTITEPKRIRTDLVMAQGSTYDGQLVGIQLEAGATVTEYESYTPNTDPQDIALSNGRKSVSPTVVCTGGAALTFNGATVNLNAGTHKILDLQLREGETPVTVSGTGTVAIIYQEGDL